MKPLTRIATDKTLHVVVLGELKNVERVIKPGKDRHESFIAARHFCRRCKLSNEPWQKGGNALFLP
jgi:hypothetical protein